MKSKARVVVVGGINTDYVVQCDELPCPGQTVQGRDLFVGPGGNSPAPGKPFRGVICLSGPAAKARIKRLRRRVSARKFI
jgi:hypothetical protein